MQRVVANHMKQHYGIDIKEESAANKKIESELKNARKVEQSKIRILVLGTGDSGKSTFIKQMMIRHAESGNPWNRDQLDRYKSMLQRNVLETIQTIIKQTEKENLTTVESVAESLSSLDPTNFTYTAQIAEDILTVWNHPSIQQTFMNRNTFQIHTSAEFFMKNLKKFSSANFVPEAQDIIHARERTVGVHETKLCTKGGEELIFIDVGGQKSERRKWLHVFDNCTAVIFVISLSGYYQVLEEDGKTNRLEDSLACLKEISSSQALSSIPFLVFMNKYDLFTSKVNEIPLNTFFTNYNGTSLDNALSFVTNLVEESFGGKELYPPYTTCALDPGNINKVWDACEEILLSTALRQSGLGR
eukprot:TRINITY_DN6769_c0_g1_i18.p1 TRINITY_DN6769_c0_g1~~TRINITY_DN6769_c0_g1_i18.p1  ORF type:complete len:359 (-),score=66.10 TRINITY_DN6769_c0_g1_i18:343-1419(-)